MKMGLTREITKAQYERAKNGSGYLTKEDRKTVFTDSERWGYGVYDGSVYEDSGRYYVSYSLGETCD
jgi:predicted GH43/DUF377 family glycosyl hydrolase